MISPAERVMTRKWFYRFQLPDGRTSPSYADDDVALLHDTRIRMLDSVVDPLFDGSWGNVSCLDVACHEGFFSIHMAQKGCRDVLGIDVRPEHVRNAELMAGVYALDNLGFDNRDVLAAAADELGQFDVVLMFGLLYHLQDPLGALRVVRDHTRKLCVIETQIAPNVSGAVDWGSRRTTKTIAGSFALVDEGLEVSSGNVEAGVRNLSLVPSVEVLVYAMNALGFQRIEIVRPLPGSHEQIEDGKRIVIAGYLDGGSGGRPASGAL